MDKAKQAALEAAGFRFGDAGDFLGLSDEERQLVELRLAVSRAVRQRRQEQRLTQKEVATRIKSSQSRVAKIEAAAPDVSLDLMFSGLFAVGGRFSDLKAQAGQRKTAGRPTATPARRGRGLKINSA